MTDYVRRRTKQEQRDLVEYVEAVEELDIDMEVRKRLGELDANGWLGLDESHPCQPTKTKLTIRLDSDMVAWYRALGNGYQTRINAVLRAYMKGVTSRWIAQSQDRDLKGNPL